jgi:Family of unknown function (DUF5681)
MANPNPKTDHLTKWQPGQSGNPAGRAKNILTAQKYCQIATKYLEMSQGDLKAVLDDPKTPMVDVTVISRLLTAKSRGDSINDLLAYVVGKPAETINQNVKNFDKDFETAPRENILKVLRDGTNE